MRLYASLLSLIFFLFFCSGFIYSQDDCDVNLIEVAIVDVTGLTGQPVFDNAHICTQSDTIRVEIGTPGITCNPTAVLTLNELRNFLPSAFIPQEVIVSGGLAGSYIAGVDYTLIEVGGLITIDFNPGALIQIDQSNPLIVDYIIEPNCELISFDGFAEPMYELDYSLPGNIPAQSFGQGIFDLLGSVSEPFLNIIASETTPEAALPGDIVCRSVTIVNNGQFSLLDSFNFQDIPTTAFLEITSFTITPIEAGVIGTPIDIYGSLTSTMNLDSISLLIDGDTYGGANSLFEVDGGVILDYCVRTQCPAEVNNSQLLAYYGCYGQTCQEATQLESVVVFFNGIPDLEIDRVPIIPADPCVDPMMWEFRIVNDSIMGGAFETVEGEADAQDVKATLYLNECTYFDYSDYQIFYAVGDGANTELTGTEIIEVYSDSICFFDLPDVGVDDTLIIKINLRLLADEGSPLECEELVNADEIACDDPWIKVEYEDRCDEYNIREQTQPLGSTFPPNNGNPIISFTEVEYVEPSYCENGRIVFEMSNISGIADPTTIAEDLQFYVQKDLCDLFDLTNFEYGSDSGTGNSTGVVVDDTSLDTFLIVMIPSSIAQGNSIFFSFELALGCRNSEACFTPSLECLMPNVKATWKNCFGLRWYREYEFGYKLMDHKPAPTGGLENFGGGAGPISFQGSGCGYRNYWYRYQFGGINHDDCSIKLVYKVAQINADGTAGTVLTAADMAAGAGSATGSYIDYTLPGIGGAPDTLVVEVESLDFESCIEDERILINAQYATVCTSAVEPVKYYESFEVVFECNNGAECCSFKRSCYENVIDCYCGSPGVTPTCYLYCLETTATEICRNTGGCGNPEGTFSDIPDPKNFALPCDTLTITAAALFTRQSASPTNPRCDTIGEIILNLDPGPHLEYCENTADFEVIDAAGAIVLSNTCGGMIPYNPINGEFDLSACIDWTEVRDGWTIEFTADWKVKEDVPACSEAFMMEEIEVEFKGKFIDGGTITNCGSPKTQKAEYYVGDPFLADMAAYLDFNNGCEVSASVIMWDECATGDLFNDYRPGYILDSIVYNISGASFLYQDGTAVLRRKGLNGAVDYPIPTTSITTDISGGFRIVFENDGSWPEELTRENAHDSLFCLNFDLEFTECYDYSSNLIANSEIYYHSCGGCGPRSISSPGGIELNNPPEAILNCLGAPLVQVANDSVQWNIQVGHTPSATFHWVALEIPPAISIYEVIDNGTGTDIFSSGIVDGDVIWWQLGAENLNDLTINALYTTCDTTYVPVHVGWSCNGYPTDPVAGEFGTDDFCNVISKELGVIRAGTDLQASFVNQYDNPVDLCDTLDFEVVVKNVGTASHFMQEFCFYIPKQGMTIIPESVCFASPDTISSLPFAGTYMPIDDVDYLILNSDTVINGQPSQKVSVNLTNVAATLGMDLELPGATFPEDNTNKYRLKWRVITDCEYISGSKLFAEAVANDRCDGAIFSTAEASNLIPIKGLDPRDYNRNQITILDTMIGACLPNQILTVNLASFPNEIGENEEVCIIVPTGVILNDATAFNPVDWDLTSPSITPSPSGDEICFLIPPGTPPGVLAFNIDITVPPTSDCGMINFGTYTKASKEAVCITTGESCELNIFTSELRDNGLELIPSLKFIDPLFEIGAECTDGDLIAITANVAVQNQGSDILPGSPVEITFFSDDNGSGELDSGESIVTTTYTDGIAASQIVYVEAAFDVTLDQLCTLLVRAGGDDCACTTNASPIDPNDIELDLCNDVPLACTGGQANLLCADLPTDGYSLSFTSDSDADLDYLDAASATFGPAPVGIYSYNVTMNLGDGCKISGNCSMQVIGELGSFTMTGEPSCVDETTKCTIALDPICQKQVADENDGVYSCEIFTQGLDSRYTRYFSYTNNGITVRLDGPSNYDEILGWNERFNDSVKTIFADFGNEVCIQNDFGIEQTVYAVPMVKKYDIDASPGDCNLVGLCGIQTLCKRFLFESGKADVDFMTPCGNFTETFEFTSYADLQMQVEAWLNSTVSTAVGGVYATNVTSSGVTLVSAMGLTCTEDGLFSIRTSTGASCTYNYALSCVADCKSGGVGFGVVFLDINGNEIETPTAFCCTESNILFRLSSQRLGCGKAIFSPLVSTYVNLTEEVFVENPLNDILLYSWEAEGGDVISQEGNCAFLRWDAVGTYEVCATPLLSPESGLDCVIPPVCKDHIVVEDDIRASVSVNPALTCNELSSVSVSFEDASMIQSFTVCDSDGATIFSEQMEGCLGLVSSLNLISENCDFGRVCNAISHSDVAEVTNFFMEGYWVFEEGTACTSFTEDGSADLTLLEEGNIVQNCTSGFGFSTAPFTWNVMTSTESLEDFLLNFLVTNSSNFFDAKACGLTGFTVEECDGKVTLLGLPANSFFVFKVAYISVGGFKEEAFLIFGDKPTTIASDFTEIFPPGDYIVKIEGAMCGDMMEVPFILPEPPSDEVLTTMICNNASACTVSDGNIAATGQTNGVIDSLVLCDLSGRLMGIDYSMASPPLFMVAHDFTDLSVGTYTIKVYSECGVAEQTCSISSAVDNVTITDAVVTQFTDCESNDAEINITIESNNTIDSIIWCGPMDMVIKDIGPHASPFSATVGPGLLYGDWTAKVYTACANTEQLYNIQTPLPGSAVEVSCTGNAPASCLESFGSLDISVSYLPTGFMPDSIVLTNAAGFKILDTTGATTVNFAPLVPGTYMIDVFTWDACNNQSIECVVPEPNDQLIISTVEVENLPCAKLFPDSITTATVNYTTDPASLQVVRVDWYRGSSVNLGTLVYSNANPGANSDELAILAGNEGEYCVVVFGGSTGLLSTCPRDTLCFEVFATECPPDCAFVMDTFDLVQNRDCEFGSTYDFSFMFESSGCLIEENLVNGSGDIKVEVIDIATGTFKGTYSSGQLIDTLNCTAVPPGDYDIVISYVESGKTICGDTITLSLINSTELEYTLGIEIIGTACDVDTGKVSVVSLVDSEGNVYNPSDFDYVFYDGFTPIAVSDSPSVPSFCDLMTGLYTVELRDPTAGCELGAIGAIVPNGESEGICPNSILPSNNCGPCDGMIIMPDSLGIVYRLQDDMGNTIFPQNAPNEHIFIDVCAGAYQVIAFDLSLADPSACPDICELNVPISDIGFTIKLDTVTASPCELDDGRILVMAVNGYCNYNYELYNLAGALISDSPVPNPSGNVCTDKSDMMIFLGVAPGEYKVVGFATDSEGNPLSCMDMDTIILRDNDIKIDIDDITIINPMCNEGVEGSFCISEALASGEIMEIWDGLGTTIASFGSSSTLPYCVTDLAADDYQIRISAGTGIFACTEIIDVSLVEPEMLECTSVTTAPSDCIEEDGSLLITVSGGTPDYTITWSDQAVVGFNPMNLPVGIYPYEVVDVNGCIKRDTVEIALPICNEPCPDIVEEFAVVDAECGASNGNIFVTVQGLDLYSYLWNTGDTGQELADLSAGIYCVTITSMTNPGCVYETCQEIDEIDGPAVSKLVTDATCNAQGAVELAINGGTPDYSIQWDGPDTLDGGPIMVTSPYLLSGPDGIYRVTVTDAAGCQNFVYAEILKEEGLQITASATQFPSCTANTGEITINVINGVFPYEYYINDVLYTTSNTSSLVVPNLGAGSYTIEVNDGTDCRGTTAVILETGGAPMSDPTDWVTVPAICSGDNGKILFSGTGAANIICEIYAENSTLPIGATPANIATSFDVPPGIYSVICEEQTTGCKDVLAGIVVTGPPPLDFIVQYQQPISCDELGSISIVEITGGYELAELDITINNSSGDIMTDQLTTGSVIEASDIFTVTICYTGTDDIAACCKERHVEIISNLSCCESLGGEVFYDYNLDGCQVGAEEIGAGGVIAYLYNCDETDPLPENALGTDVTDGQGQYYFGPDEDGDAAYCIAADSLYYIVFDIPNADGEVLEGFVVTIGTGLSCSSTANSDDVDSNTGQSACYDPEDNDGEDGDSDEHIDIGITPCETLGGQVFYDWDQNGCQDQANETGAEDITVYLYSCGETAPTPGNAIATDTTDADGAYSFGSMEEGSADICLHLDSTYYVVFDIPNATGEALDGFDFTPGDSSTCAGDPTSDDVDSNTGQSDCYDPEDDDPEDDDDDEDIDVGITPCETLGGQVFYDWDQNGCQDQANETGAEDVTVYLYSCGETAPTTGNAIATDTTDADGAYSFGSMEEGSADICLHPDSTYYVVFDIPNATGEALDGFDFTPGDSSTCAGDPTSDDVDSNTGQSACYNPEDDDPDDDDADEDIDVGITPCETLGGQVFYDWDQNGCQDQPNETGVEDVTVYLFSCGETATTPGNAIAIDTTDANGAYSFGSMEEGSADICLHPDSMYYVVFDIPNAEGEDLEGYDFTPGDSGTCEGVPNSDDVDSNTGQSACYDPEDDDPDDDDADEDIDVGITPCETMGGTAFIDWDEDGCQDQPGETGMEGLIAYIYSCGENDPTPENALATDTTDVNGEYSFGSMEEGSADICLHPYSTYYIVFGISNLPGQELEGYSFTEGTSASCAGGPNSDDINPNTGQSDCYDPEDDNGDDNDEHVDVGIIPIVDVALVKTTTQTGPFRYGDVIIFDLEVFNQGMMDLYKIKVNDFIPCGYKYLSVNNSDWSYEPFNSVATTTIPYIAIGDSEVIKIQLEIAPCTLAGAWYNIAEVEKFEDDDGRDITIHDIDSDGDDNPNNDTTTDNEFNEDGKDGGDEDDNDPEEVDVFDLALIKTAVSLGPYVMGSEVTYNIKVVNQGNMTAANVEIMDHLPPGLGFSAALNPGWSASGIDVYAYTIPDVIQPGAEINIPFIAILELLEITVENYTNIAEISDNTDENGGPVRDADSDPDSNPNNDGIPIDNQLNDKGDEDDHDPEVLDLTQDLPPDCAFDCTLACHHELNMTLNDEDCSTEIQPTDLISGLEEACNSDLYYTVTLTDEYGNDIDPPIVTLEHIGQRLTYKVSNICQNSCWGYLNVEFKQGPVIDCDNIMTSCLMFDLECEAVLPEVSPGCGVAVVSMELSANSYEFFDCDPYTMVINRSYRAIDAAGNVSECDQEISLEPMDPSLIAFPKDIAIACGDERFEYNDQDFPEPWSIDPEEGITSGVPLYVFGDEPVSLCEEITVFPNATNTSFMTELGDQSGLPCNAIITYSDVEVPSGGCNRKLMRTWELVMWSCGSTTSENMVQVIELTDITVPVITCPSDTTIIATIDCKATIDLPLATATDDCSASLLYTTSYEGGFNYGNGGIAELALGIDTVTYIVYDGCDNSSTCDVEVTVIDSNIPTAVCDQSMSVTINSSGEVMVPAQTFDEGSYSSCTDLEYTAMRMELLSLFDGLSADTLIDHKKYVLLSRLDMACSNNLVGIVVDGIEYISKADLWQQRIAFCCTDALEEVMVMLQVKDKAGASNICMSTVFVKDIGSSDIVCPSDVNLDCDQEIDLMDLTAYGLPQVRSNCDQVYTILEDLDDRSDVCMIGTIERKMYVTDSRGDTLGSCIQELHFNNINAFDPLTIIWPADIEVGCISTLDELEPDPDVLGSVPTWPVDVACALVGSDHADQFFFVDINQPECGKLVRTWSIIDWCDPVGSGFQTYTHSQTIKVVNEVSPVMADLEDVTISSDDPDCEYGDVSLSVTGNDDCTPTGDLTWSYIIYLESGVELSGVGNTTTGKYPLGEHTILWTVRDGCNNMTSKSQVVTIVNDKAPTPICKSGVSINIEAEWAYTELPSSNLDAGSTQACDNPVGIFYDPAGTVTEMVFDCDNLGENVVPLYVVDLVSGNYAECFVTVTVTDNSLACEDSNLVFIAGELSTTREQAIELVIVDLMPENLLSEMTNVEGEYAFQAMPVGGTYVVTPLKDDDHLNGVSTLDLILIQRHILGIEALEDPYDLVAADINNSENINGVDLVELRKLILGKYESYPENTSWRFIERSYQFPDRNDPWLEPISETYLIPELMTNMEIDFIGIKVGDVNGTVIANADDLELDSRSTRWPLIFEIEEAIILEEELVSIPVYARNYEDVSGWQGGLSFDPSVIQIMGINGAAVKLTEDNYNMNSITKGYLSFSYAGKIPEDIKEESVLFEIVVRAKQEVRASNLFEISSVLTKTEAYRGLSTVIDIQLELRESSGVEILSVNPNPWVTESDIHFHTPHREKVKWEFYDVSGKLLFELSEEYPAGENVLVITKEDINYNGVLYVRLMTEEGIANYKMMVVK